MNYYQHHIGDFNNATRHLSRLERSIYRDLLDLYYDLEKPLQLDFDKLARRIMVEDDERGAMRDVLNEFFVLQDDGYHNARADREIASFQRMAIGGKMGAAKRWAKGSDSPPITTPLPPQAKANANHEPVTINHKPNTPQPPKGEPEGFAEFYAAYPRKESRKLAAKAFANVTAPLPVLLAALAWQRNRETWTKEGGKYVPLPASWLNGEKWKDERPAPQPGDTPAWYETKAGVERKAASVGIGPYNEVEEQFPTYRARVMQVAREAGPSFGKTLDQLAAIAAQRQAA